MFNTHRDDFSRTVLGSSSTGSSHKWLVFVQFSSQTSHQKWIKNHLLTNKTYVLPMKIETSALTVWHGTNKNTTAMLHPGGRWSWKIKKNRSEKAGNHPALEECHHHMWLRTSGHPLNHGHRRFVDDRNQPGSTRCVKEKSWNIDDQKMMIRFKLRQWESWPCRIDQRYTGRHKNIADVFSLNHDTYVGSFSCCITLICLMNGQWLHVQPKQKKVLHQFLQEGHHDDDHCPRRYQKILLLNQWTSLGGRKSLRCLSFRDFGSKLPELWIQIFSPSGKLFNTEESLMVETIPSPYPPIHRAIIWTRKDRIDRI